MSIDKNHSEQFERYLKGEMHPQEAHVFEREVLDDPFTQEALEGFEAQELGTLEDIKKLKDQIAPTKKKSSPFMKIAAVVALLITGSFSVYLFTNQLEHEKLAMEKESPDEIIQSSPSPDTVSVLIDRRSNTEGGVSSAETNQSKTSKQDELKVSKEAIEIALREEEAPEEISHDVVDETLEVKLEEKTNFSADLQDHIAEAQLENESEPELPLTTTESVQSEDVALDTEPLVVAKEEAFSNVMMEADEESPRVAKKARTYQPSATLRSTSGNKALISGKVTDEYGEPLPGVNVVTKGTTIGVTTDLNGNYQIPKVEGQVLIYTFVGFESQEIEVGKRSTIDVTLGGSAELQEVVVVGYDGADEAANSSYSKAKPTIGYRAFKKYLEDNLQYPKAAKTNEIDGTVVLALTISSSGEISSISIKKSLGYGCDQEAIRLMNKGPKWAPADRNGINIESTVRVKIKFKLD